MLLSRTRLVHVLSIAGAFVFHKKHGMFCGLWPLDIFTYFLVADFPCQKTGYVKMMTLLLNVFYYGFNLLLKESSFKINPV